MNARFDYQEMADTALELITEFGKTWKIRRVIDGVEDPIEGTIGGGTTTEHDVEAVMVEIDEDYSDKYSGISEANDMIMLIAPGFRPTAGDKMIDGAEVWSIVSLNPIRPADVDVCYEALVRP